MKANKSKKAVVTEEVTPVRKGRTRKSKETPTVVETPVVEVVEKPKNKKSKAVATEIARGANGCTYEINPETKTCKKVFTDLSDLGELADDLLKGFTQSLNTYRNFLKDKFNEDARIKKGKLFFRGYRMYFSEATGFVIDDFKNNILNIETKFEGIPTPKELGEFFTAPKVEHSAEELLAAVERGKKKESPKKLSTEEKKLLIIAKLEGVLTGKVTGFDVESVPTMITWKRWVKAINGEISLWKNRKIRFKTLVQNMIEITEEETFSDEPVKPIYKFVGTQLPEFKTIGNLIGNKIEVDGTLKDAVPFLQNYILYYEPDAMFQLMQFADGEVDKFELLQNPLGGSVEIEYNSKKLKNTPENATILTLLCATLGVVAPQDLVYEGLSVGDKLLLCIDGEWFPDTVMAISEGVVLQKGVGLLKSDKWMLVESAKVKEEVTEETK